MDAQQPDELYPIAVLIDELKVRSISAHSRLAEAHTDLPC